jgi:hypothetical protein
LEAVGEDRVLTEEAPNIGRRLSEVHSFAQAEVP